MFLEHLLFPADIQLLLLRTAHFARKKHFASNLQVSVEHLIFLEEKFQPNTNSKMVKY